jgi:hypothetical protein
VTLHSWWHRNELQAGATIFVVPKFEAFFGAFRIDGATCSGLMDYEMFSNDGRNLPFDRKFQTIWQCRKGNANCLNNRSDLAPIA